MPDLDLTEEWIYDGGRKVAIVTPPDNTPLANVGRAVDLNYLLDALNTLRTATAIFPADALGAGSPAGTLLEVLAWLRTQIDSGTPAPTASSYATGAYATGSYA